MHFLVLLLVFVVVMLGLFSRQPAEGETRSLKKAYRQTTVLVRQLLIGAVLLLAALVWLIWYLRVY